MSLKSPLVSAADLAAHPEWRVFDCRHDLANPELGAQQFAAGHIPGAVHAHLDRVLSGPTNGRNGRHPLPDPDALCEWLRAQGVHDSDVIVACDASGGAYAARLWWLLRWLGHGDVAVLDGGLPAWEAGGGVLVTDVVDRTPARFERREPLVDMVNTADVQANLEQAQFLVVDARGAGRYAGEGETLDPRAGHIPGAHNRPFTDNLDASGRFHPAARLRADFDRVTGGQPPGQVVAQCGSGVTACHNLLAMELAGLPGARLYPGSWSEWCSDDTRPLASGPLP
ncbi:3-mercaptopyruvate sulfurtransferase [Hydrogenophaga sp. Root209]|uniref:sulfurtransferase n=1 Tax=Hydrogenophaga sp. Root209 TaxID=1736490 RepID=UPI0006FD6EDD|nr:sulfurtransferase [Hydrogenophaga sp. Root209]KRC12316.1 3-mercaptopyruvate sulfurtransferase [Hydrogenophaga sp. Root209]